MTTSFEKDEIVWHIPFEAKVRYLGTYKDGWHYIQLLSNGGFMDTKPTSIEKYVKQRKKPKKKIKSNLKSKIKPQIKSKDIWH